MLNFVFCFDRIDNITLIADEYLGNEIFDRVKLLLPQSICGCQLAGINARYRFFRYFAGILFFFLLLALTPYNIYSCLFVCLSYLLCHSDAVYRPHIDGAWPGSGVDSSDSGCLVDDFYGDRTSRLTFLMYLNEGRSVYFHNQLYDSGHS